MKKRNSGFTLVEVVVVLAVVAILAAILTPNIVKNIKDSKIARANSDAVVIAASLASFYKDVGRWPTADGASAVLPDVNDLLYGAGNDPAATTGGTDWDDDTATSSDLFTNHLIANDPGGAANDYAVPVSGSQLGWNGPYLANIKPDPWGGYYVCNIENAYDGSRQGVWVLSFGPNRDAETPFDLADTVITPTGDDIGLKIQ